jgi:chemotaxis protein CheX
MSAAYLKPVVSAVLNVFNTMIEVPIISGKPTFKKEKRPTTEVAALILMSGPVYGFFCLGFSKSLAFYLSSKLLECAITEENSDCADAVGEIINMIAGNAKSDFPDGGISISTPRVIFDAVKEPYPTNAPIVTIPFETQGETLLVDLSIVRQTHRPSEIVE